MPATAQRTVCWLAGHVDHPAGARVLDIGCGAGSFRQQAAKRTWRLIDDRFLDNDGLFRAERESGLLIASTNRGA